MSISCCCEMHSSVCQAFKFVCLSTSPTMQLFTRNHITHHAAQKEQICSVCLSKQKGFTSCVNAESLTKLSVLGSKQKPDSKWVQSSCNLPKNGSSFRQCLGAFFFSVLRYHCSDVTLHLIKNTGSEGANMQFLC